MWLWLVYSKSNYGSYLSSPIFIFIFYFIYLLGLGLLGLGLEPEKDIKLLIGVLNWLVDVEH